MVFVKICQQNVLTTFEKKKKVVKEAKGVSSVEGLIRTGRRVVHAILADASSATFKAFKVPLPSAPLRKKLAIPLQSITNSRHVVKARRPSCQYLKGLSFLAAGNYIFR